MQNMALIYYLMNILTGCLALTLVILFHIFRGPEVYKYASRVMLLFWLWIATELMEYFTLVPSRKILYNILQFVPVALLPIVWLNLCYYIRRGYKIEGKLKRRLPYLFSLTFITLIFTNPWHRLMWEEAVVFESVYPVIKEMKPLCHALIIMVFLMILAGILIIVLPRRSGQKRPVPGRPLIVFFAIIALSTAVWEWKSGYLFPFELAPLTFTMVALSSLFSIRSYLRTQILLNRFNILYSMKDPLFLVRDDGIVVYANRAAMEEFRISENDLFETEFKNLIPSMKDMNEEMIFHAGHFYHVNINTVNRDHKGLYTVALTEVTELKGSEMSLKQLSDELEKQVESRTESLDRSKRQLEQLVDEKNILLQEVHHRVNNNLQMIISLLNLQSRRSEDPELRDRLSDAVSRVQTISMVHQMLYRSEDFSRINLREYLESLILSMVHQSALKPELKFCDLICSTSTCIQVGMIMNEIVLNAMKYAYPLEEENKRFYGESHIEKSRDKSDILHVMFRDFGPGIDEEILDDVERGSLGFRIIRTLTAQRNGSVRVYNDDGCVYEFDVEI
jgi:two-component sensor histidine kinase